ncbi:MAG: hypothetical protein IJN88_00790 [Clostridia bacterium]|nr:hypothetical protein [Clostridia bacterium]
MDELKKDGLLPEEEDNTASGEMTEDFLSDEEASEEKEELYEELENIRDMFQQELDRASAEEYEDGMLIQELENHDELSEEYDTDEQEIPPEDLCQCCEEKIRFKELGDDYPYCEDCRNAMKKYPLRKSGILAALIAVILFLASIYISYPYLNDAMTVADASANYKSGNIMSALQTYYSYFNGAKSAEKISNRAFSEIIAGYNKLGYQANGAELINVYYTEDQLKRPWNKKYADTVKEATVLTETYEAVSEVTADALSGKDFDFDKVMAELDALKEAKPLEEGKSQVTEKYNEVFIEYYKFVLMSIKEKPLSEQLDQLKYIDSIGAGQEWVYLSNYCATAARLGDEEAVNYSFDKLLEINKEDNTAYISKASLYRFMENPDADKMIAVCEEAKAALGASDVSYKHPLAIAYLIKGEGALALEEIKGLFSAGNYTVQNCNLYALVGLYNGDKEIYEDMKELLSGYGYEISELVTQYKKGKITIEEIIKDQGGDI